MIKFSMFFVSTIIIGMLCGCGGIYVVDPLFDVTAKKTDCNGIMVNNKRMVNQQCDDYASTFLAASNDIAKRNLLITQMLTVSDEICKQHKGDVRATSTNFNVGFGTLTTLFAGTASLTTGAATNTYAALAAASNSSRSLINEEVYRREMADAVLRAIEIRRETKRREIDSGLKTLSPKEYPIEQGIRDISAYHDMCSFVDGMTFVTQSIESRKETRTNIQLKVSQLRDEYNKNATAISGVRDAGHKSSLESQNEALLGEIIRLSTQASSAPE